MIIDNGGGGGGDEEVEDDDVTDVLMCPSTREVAIVLDVALGWCCGDGDDNDDEDVVNDEV